MLCEMKADKAHFDGNPFALPNPKNLVKSKAFVVLINL